MTMTILQYKPVENLQKICYNRLNLVQGGTSYYGNLQTKILVKCNGFANIFFFIAPLFVQNYSLPSPLCLLTLNENEGLEIVFCL